MTNKERLDRINTLDLSPIKEYLIRHFNWSRNSVDEAGAEYRKFLFLAAKYGPDAVMPWDRNILSFWKVHILHTRKYFEDCQRTLGFYLHYDPSISRLLGKEASKDDLADPSGKGSPTLLSKTIDLYTKEYSKNPLK